MNYGYARCSKYRLIGYENRQLQDNDFDDDTKDAGDVGAGQTLTILYEIVPTKAPARTTTSGAASTTSSTTDITTSAVAKNKSIKEGMTLNIRYKNNYTAKSTKVSHPINTTPSNNLSDDFTFVSTVAELVMFLNDSEYAKNTTIADLYNKLKDINLEDEEKAELAMLIKNLGNNSDY